MLILSRKKDEKIKVGNNVEVTVLEIRSGAVRLGITAPNEMPVHRYEVWAKIQEDKGVKN